MPAIALALAIAMLEISPLFSNLETRKIGVFARTTLRRVISSVRDELAMNDRQGINEKDFIIMERTYNVNM